MTDDPAPPPELTWVPTGTRGGPRLDLSKIKPPVWVQAELDHQAEQRARRGYVLMDDLSPKEREERRAKWRVQKEKRESEFSIQRRVEAQRVRLDSRARIVGDVIDGLETAYYYRPDDTMRQAIGRWACGHYAVGGPSNLHFQDQRDEGERFTRDDFTLEAARVLQYALEDYVLGLPTKIFGLQNTIGKAARLMGLRNDANLTDRRDLAREKFIRFVHKHRPGLYREDYLFHRWGFVYLSHPTKVDLIDRDVFLRVCHFTNLFPVTSNFERPPVPSYDIFDPSITRNLRWRERYRGQFTDKEYVGVIEREGDMAMARRRAREMDWFYRNELDTEDDE